VPGLDFGPGPGPGPVGPGPGPGFGPGALGAGAGILGAGTGSGRGRGRGATTGIGPTRPIVSGHTALGVRAPDAELAAPPGTATESDVYLRGKRATFEWRILNFAAERARAEYDPHRSHSLNSPWFGEQHQWRLRLDPYYNSANMRVWIRYRGCQAVLPTVWRLFYLGRDGRAIPWHSSGGNAFARDAHAHAVPADGTAEEPEWFAHCPFDLQDLLHDGDLTIRVEVDWLKLDTDTPHSDALAFSMMSAAPLRGANLQHDVAEMLGDASLADAVLVAEDGTRLPVHRAILAARSAFFQDFCYLGGAPGRRPTR